MKLKLAFISLIVAFNLCACYTLVTNPEIDGMVPNSMNGVRFINGNNEFLPRIFLSVGIVTLKADYSKWTDKLLVKYSQNRISYSQQPIGSKWLSFSFQSIACGGSFITNCSATVKIESSDGGKLLFSTDNYYGYGWPVAMDKVIDDIALRLKADAVINKFLYQ